MRLLSYKRSCMNTTLYLGFLFQENLYAIKFFALIYVSEKGLVTAAFVSPTKRGEYYFILHTYKMTNTVTVLGEGVQGGLILCNLYGKY